MFCRNCGNQLDDDALFCMSCGIKLSEKGIFKYCVHCGNALEDDAVFCMSCGKKVQEEETETENVTEDKVEVETVTEEKSAEQDAQNDEPISDVEVEKPIIETKAVLDETPQKETTEDKNESATNTIKNETQNKKSYGLLVGVIIVIIAISTGIYFGTKQNNPWTGSDKQTGMDVFNLDVLNVKSETFTNNDGDVEIVNCYRISNTDFEKLWDSIPNVSLIYGGTSWHPFDPEYDKIEDYNDSLRPLMWKYDILCSQIYHYDDGGRFLWIYLINRRTGQVIAF